MNPFDLPHSKRTRPSQLGKETERSVCLMGEHPKLPKAPECCAEFSSQSESVGRRSQVSVMAFNGVSYEKAERQRRQNEGTGTHSKDID
jgi:hypothetical protein